MSGAGFHVHGPHDHELEHAQQHAAHGGHHEEAAHHGIGGGRYNCHVWKTAPSYFAGNVRAGTLNAGTNYFYCQAVGSEVVDGPYRNHWWAKTDDDSGNKGVWVNVVHLSGEGSPEEGASEDL